MHDDENLITIIYVYICIHIYMGYNRFEPINKRFHKLFFYVLNETILVDNNNSTVGGVG